MRRSLLGTLLLTAALVSPMAAGLFRVWVHHEAVQMGYALSDEGARRRDLRRRQRQLQVELAAERSPASLARLAKKNGLRPAAPDQVLAGRPGRQR
jgi:hypothetical protein